MHRRRRHAEVHVPRRRRPRLLLLLLVVILLVLLLLEGGRVERLQLLLMLGGQCREARPLLFPLLHLVLLVHLRADEHVSQAIHVLTEGMHTRSDRLSL